MTQYVEAETTISKVLDKISLDLQLRQSLADYLRTAEQRFDIVYPLFVQGIAGKWKITYEVTFDSTILTLEALAMMLEDHLFELSELFNAEVVKRKVDGFSTIETVLLKFDFMNKDNYYNCLTILKLKGY